MEKDLLFRARILHPHLLSPSTHPTTLLPSAQPHQDSITVSEGEDPASLVPGVITNAAHFLPSVLLSGPGSAAKKLTHLEQNFSLIWKEQMLFLLGDERV